MAIPRALAHLLRNLGSLSFLGVKAADFSEFLICSWRARPQFRRRELTFCVVSCGGESSEPREERS